MKKNRDMAYFYEYPKNTNFGKYGVIYASLYDEGDIYITDPNHFDVFKCEDNIWSIIHMESEGIDKYNRKYYDWRKKEKSYKSATRLTNCLIARNTITRLFSTRGQIYAILWMNSDIHFYKINYGDERKRMVLFIVSELNNDDYGNIYVVTVRAGDDWHSNENPQLEKFFCEISSIMVK